MNEEIKLDVVEDHEDNSITITAFVEEVEES